MQITEKQYTLITKLYTSMRVCTHQRSPVQSKPVQSHSRRCGLLTIAAAAERTHQQRELSRVPQVLPSQESWWRMFYFHQSRLQWSGVMEEMEEEKIILLDKDHEAIYNALHWEDRNSVLLWWRHCSYHTHTHTHTVTIVIMFILLLRFLFKVFIRYFWHSKEWQPTSNWLQIKESVCISSALLLLLSSSSLVYSR